MLMKKMITEICDISENNGDVLDLMLNSISMIDSKVITILNRDESITQWRHAIESMFKINDEIRKKR